ncbi:hypothetical protein [Hymenobacter pini]|uniref:hypothetical protein n=1 Tax=Hymenobacter pini TaxID=2880879 RepID=UPI001CF4535E|nr:hypothetical protein [Hymenobacter pini]MCA8829831.1 hypothetical protein [Hymenobacter pini]
MSYPVDNTTIRGSLLYDTLLPRMYVVSWLLTIAGFIAKSALQPVGNHMLVIGMHLLAVCVLLLAFKPRLSPLEPVNYRASSSFLLNVVLPKTVHIGASIVCVGMLFKLMTWAGYQPLMLIGGVLLLGSWLYQALAGRYSRGTGAIAALGLILYSVPEADLIRYFHRDDTVLADKMIYQAQHSNDPAAAQAVRSHLQAKRQQP